MEIFVEQLYFLGTRLHQRLLLLELGLEFPSENLVLFLQFLRLALEVLHIDLGIFQFEDTIEEFPLLFLAFGLQLLNLLLLFFQFFSQASKLFLISVISLIQQPDSGFVFLNLSSFLLNLVREGVDFVLQVFDVLEGFFVFFQLGPESRIHFVQFRDHF